ncbi:MAG: hypothetical protein M0R73_12945 [Dehalococcoidia bacterium]|nr:hypothetical protein [Dehalococcoidia bacterium]
MSLTRAMKRISLGVALTASLLLLACSEDDPTPTPTATETATETVTEAPTATPVTGGGGEDAAQDVDPSACDGIERLVAGAFPDATLLRDATAFEAGSLVGQGCRVLVTGDADELPTFVEVAQALRGALEADGWTEDIQYAADGPTGTASVYEKGEDQVLVSAGVSPKDPSVCPPDQIISECLEGLEPDEVEVHGSVVLRID